jgi:hypothetical protein
MIRAALVVFLTPLASSAAPCVLHAQGDHLACVSVAAAPADLPITPVSAEQRRKMKGVSWHEGCPVAIDQLSVVTVPYIDPAGAARRGEVVVATQQAKAIQSVFVKLYEARFPIARVDPIEAFGGDDEKSMAANNTSGFNCRSGKIKERWSRHAYGEAVDINPLWNPQVRPEGIAPPEGAAWKDRTLVKPGMTIRDGLVVRAFKAIGWHWGGVWPKPKDYQHFSANGH